MLNPLELCRRLLDRAKARRSAARGRDKVAPRAIRIGDLRLPHVDLREAGARVARHTLRLPHVDFKLPQVEVKLPHLQMRLPHVDFRMLNVEDLALLLGEAPRSGRRAPRWLRYVAGCMTVLALVFGFRLLDRVVTQWSISSEPAGAWAGEAAEWYQLYAGLTEDELSVPEPAEQGQPAAQEASILPASATEKHRPTTKEQRFVRVAVTAYTSAEEQTDDSPTITASNTHVSDRTVAVSRDLLREYTPGAPLRYGDKILIPGVGIYRVEDTMNGRWRRKIDLWFATKDEARRWGVRTAYITRVEESAPTVAYRVTQ